MNWFKRLVIKWVRDDWNEAGAQAKVRSADFSGLKIGLAKDATQSSRSSVDSNPTLQFRVWNAVGGRVVEFTRYDERYERTQHSVYIVSDDQDFGARIAKIATMESLKG